MTFKEGDYVRIIERDVTSTDLKNGTFYPYFRGLAGVVDRIYDKEICIRVDPETLPEDVLKRHLDIQESIKQKWLNGLSGEARNRLTPQEKQFELAYTMLIQSTDLEKIKPGEAGPVAIKSMRPLNPPKAAAARKAAAAKEVEAPQKPAKAVKKAEAAQEIEKPRPAKAAAPPKTAKAAAAKKVTAKEETGKPLTSTDLNVAETAYLKEREKALKGEKQSR